MKQKRSTQTCNSNGFTIVELMVVIGVIGALLSIILPALRSVRDAGREIVCVANLKGLGVTMHAYTQVHNGRYPFVPNDEDIMHEGDDGIILYPSSPDPDDGQGTGVAFPAWSIELLWPTLMHNVAPWREHYDSWICPGAERGPEGPWDLTHLPSGSSYSYSTSFIAAPSLWSGRPEADLSLLRPTHVWEVAHPTGKVLMWDDEMAHLSVRSAATLDRVPMLFADGHAAVMRRSEAATPVLNPITGEARKLIDTPNGIDGVDY